jgi:TraX protein
MTPLTVTGNVAVPVERLPVVGKRAPGTLRVADGTIEALKWLAVALMAIDHANKYLADGKMVWAFTAGRVCLPLFCFVLAYNLTRAGVLEGAGFTRVMKRTFGVGVLATPAFIALGGLLFYWWPLNIMFTLCVATLMLMFVARGGMGNYLLAALVFLLGGALVEFWWLGLALCLASWRYCKAPGVMSFVLLFTATASLYFINRNGWALAALPIILVAPFVAIHCPRVRFGFYIFYPLHLALLWGARLLITSGH